MATRKPIVRSGGRNKQLAAGDVLLGIPVYAPAYQQSGTLLRIALTSTYSTPVYKQDATQLAVGVVING